MTQTNKTAIICFRAHKNLKSWLVYAGRGFTGGKSELLRLVIIRATMEQPHNNGLGSFLARIVGNSRQPASVIRPFLLSGCQWTLPKPKHTGC